ncbi:MAG: hypothetical protein QOF77_594 [Solirubrobacteraceae bacterium]|jgi:hypothetical protein|nr:hypothetical protein [Solirubrobacteraceae bacterium]
MKTTTIAGRLAVLALTVGLSACGSSSSNNSTTTTTATTTTAAAGLSRSELATRADKICATAQSQSSTIKAPGNLAADATAAAAYFDKVFPITDAETKEIQALTPASDAATDWQSFVSAQVAADQLLQTIKQKADVKDASGLNDLGKVKPAGQAVATAAKKIGATTCAGG